MIRINLTLAIRAAHRTQNRCYSRASSKRWLDRQKQDFYTRESKLDNLRSRAGFKLAQLDDVYHVFHKSVPQRILDLGYAPGAWSQVARKRTHPDSIVLGVDILPCDPPFGVSSMQANILSKRTHQLIRQFFMEQIFMNDSQVESMARNDSDTEQQPQFPVNIILSDMMSNTSGLNFKDHLNSIDLCDAALITAVDLLEPAGSFICKQFSGAETNLFEKRMKKVFDRVEITKPSASRDESKEIYFIGKKKKKNVDKLDVFC
ncbi:FtsJ-like methyltransferase [Nakaseomyces glabratus]|nr:FtsJ-like methyltransferase [Nakaseomyces glabratus]KAH7592353.1 FtsJ-like methyltransferase [Nakaseomyces glabratus]KAI8386491.1 FtsJ-like methyltransferase [Nakaseomyces glabratus]QNG14533.1 uncharacterized protein GWK60_H08921 [Nakaseomyces glabratus]UCS21171.1 uncharacterized protein GW608_H09009 [Nakaseomyces glabratus]